MVIGTALRVNKGSRGKLHVVKVRSYFIVAVLGL
jgi:hypothetical protein